MTPMAMPAMNATGRLTMAPTSAAVSASSSRSGLSTSVSALVWPGALRMAVNGRQHAGDGPGDGRRPPHPDARQAGRVGVLGHGPHGEAPRREPDEEGQRDGHERRHDQREHLARS